jgi:hypothetical protein
VSGSIGALAAFVRQIHIWTAAPIAVSALWPVDSRESRHTPHPPDVSTRIGFGAVTLRLLAPALLPVVAISSLVLLWGGLLPPRFVGHHGGWNVTTFVFGLALIGLYGAPWMLLMSGDVRRTLTSGIGAIALAAAAISASAPSSYNVEAGRWGGWLWEVVRRFPVLFDRSVVLTLLAFAGAAVVGTLSRRAVDRGRSREACLLVVAMVAWLAAQSANFQVWQRYFEPAVLILLAWLIALAPPPVDNGRWALPFGMTIAVAAVTLVLVHGDVYGFVSAR